MTKTLLFRAGVLMGIVMILAGWGVVRSDGLTFVGLVVTLSAFCADVLWGDDI